MIQTKHRMGVKRNEYASIDRNPVRVVSFASDSGNIGGLCRSAEAFLVEELYLMEKPARSTSVGTDKWQPIDLRSSKNLHMAIDLARTHGYTVVALEQTNKSELLGKALLPEKMCLVVGNESYGIPNSALKKADMAVEIKQLGFVGSLNVVTATGIALYEWARQWRRG